MYPIDDVYSCRAFEAWREHLHSRSKINETIDLRPYKSGWEKIRDGEPWRVRDWKELRSAVSFLTLMNKRDVLYFRGQGSHHTECLPVLFRSEWKLNKTWYPLTADNRYDYFSEIQNLRADVLRVAKSIGTPREYVLEFVPAASAAILQHYELWPTPYVDVTRSLLTALAFARGAGDRSTAVLYVFALPDLRGSITSDMDQQLSLSRLEAVCPPDAVRPHHQDAYLVGRFPEPPFGTRPASQDWVDWQKKSDLMRRLVARFELELTDGNLANAPQIPMEFLIPPPAQDSFSRMLNDELLTRVEEKAKRISG